MHLLQILGFQEAFFHLHPLVAGLYWISLFFLHLASGFDIHRELLSRLQHPQFSNLQSCLLSGLVDTVDLPGL